MISKISIIIGRRGQGKTYRAKSIISHLPRVLIYDINREFTNMIAVQDPDILRELARAPRFQLSYIPKSRDRDLDYFCRLALWAKNLVAVFDEAGLLVSPASCPEPLENLIRFSRLNNIHIFFITHRPADFSRYITSQATDFFIYQTSEPRDLQYLSQYCGIDMDRVKTLPLYKCLHVDLMSQGKTEVI